MRILATLIAMMVLCGMQYWQLSAEPYTRRFAMLEKFDKLDSLEYELLSLAIGQGIESRQLQRGRVRFIFERKASINLTAEDIFHDKLYNQLTCCSTFTFACNIQSLKKETFDNFVEKSFRDNLVEGRFDLPVDYSVRGEGGGSESQHPSMLSPALPFDDTSVQTVSCLVSRVGFDREMKQAFLHFEEDWGPLAGSATYFLLKRTEKGWIIAGQCVDWIS